MTRKLVLTAAAAALTVPLSVALAAPASAAPSAGGACVQAGLGTLKSLDLLQAAAHQEIDYSTLAGPNGIRLPLEKGTYLSLGAVVKLHASNPELFAWCD